VHVSDERAEVEERKDVGAPRVEEECVL